MGEKRHRAPGDLLLRRAHGRATCSSSRSSRRSRDELPDFRFVPALSEAGPDDGWDGESGLDHRRGRPARRRPRRRRRLPVRPAADGRRGDRPARAAGRARSAHLLRQVHDHRAAEAATRRGRQHDPGDHPRAAPRSVPKPVFTDAEAGPRSSRPRAAGHYNYFTPQKRRATVYEDVTVDVQPDPERHLTQGWVYGFADGDGGYPQEWTALQLVELARVPRPQRGVGADDLPQQRERRPPDPAAASPTPRPRTRSRSGTARGRSRRSGTSARGRTPSTASACTSTCPPSATRRRT